MKLPVIGTITEVPSATNGFRFRVVVNDVEVHHISPFQVSGTFAIGDRVRLQYVSTSSRGWYTMVKT